MIRRVDGGAQFDVRVMPRARKTTADGVRDNAILIRLAAPPVEGAANAALIRYLSSVLEVPQRAVRIVSGSQTRNKRVEVDGVTVAEITAALLG
jgi:hypothetical protein